MRGASLRGVYTRRERVIALELLGSGLSVAETSRRTGVSRWTLRDWRHSGPPAAQCPRCEDAALPHAPYSALLGYYLGDGCVSRLRGYYSLRISCDAGWPGIVADVSSCMQSMRPAREVSHVRAPGAVVVQSNWKHWPCLFPQHGPGRKHERPIVLEQWQQRLVEAHPADFLRGLFHSDGCRVKNWTRKLVGGDMKRYDYPRWQFTNHSADIRELCCWALDLVDVAWRQSNHVTISVSRRADVARLDGLIGPKR